MLETKTIAPNFELLNQDLKKTTLAEFLGSFVVVYFYPKDDTPGCTVEACAIRDSYSEFAKAGVVVLGISQDSPQSHMQFIKKYQLPFILLSDPNEEVIKQYGAYAMPFNKRITYIISPKGEIAKAYEEVQPASHAKQILEDIINLK
jgi:thioredoxin-dependent peroxiredoxin